MQELSANGEEANPPPGWRTVFSAELGRYQAAVDQVLDELREKEIVPRIWAHDHTVWSTSEEEITNRLGWLHLPHSMVANLPRIQALVQALEEEGSHTGSPYKDIWLLGMGGSSLAPEVFSNIFSGEEAGLNLKVLDSTDPGAVLAAAESVDPRRTLFIVATKSGGTVETLSFFKYFYNWTAEALGVAETGRHFVAITDPGSKLADIAQEYRFRTTFLNDPNLGGRYSALSYFGAVPAALVGVNVKHLLSRARSMANLLKNGKRVDIANNPGAWLGGVMGALAQSGRDKIILFTSPALANFGDWVEQLIAESTGKDDQGILPVVGEVIDGPEAYGDDSLFVYLGLEGDGDYEEELGALVSAGHPLVKIHIEDKYDLGGQFMMWEMATAVAGHVIGIQPFNQPNVESAKVLARQMVAAFQEQGQLPQGESTPLEATKLAVFLNEAMPGDYIAIQAFSQPTEQATKALQAFRLRLRRKTRLATTLGFGPRFLHSTGQLHKGDGGNGHFIQLVSVSDKDAPIPDRAGEDDSSISFGVLKEAQALGDAQALLQAGRRLIRFRLTSDDIANLTGRLDRLLAEL
jgi:glucose-6-phosphate isomerase